MISNDLYFTFIKIKYDYKNMLVCKYWYTKIRKHLKKKKENFYDMQLYNAITNKYMYVLYNKTDDIITRAHDNIIKILINDICRDNDIKNSMMDNIIENYKKLCIVIASFNKNNIRIRINRTDNRDNHDNYNSIENYNYNSIENYIAAEYAKILSDYYDYNIILA